MFGTLRGALAGRKIAFDRDTFTAEAAVPPDALGAIEVTWDARVRAGDRTVELRG